MVPSAEFLSVIQSRTARVAVGPSTVRGQRVRGVVKAGRDFLRQLDLGPFGTDSGSRFDELLDKATRDLVTALPSGADYWGVARKLVNIFLRDCLYTAYLRDEFHLQRAEAYFEIPLDSIIAKELRRAAGRGRLATWPGVRHLSSELSSEYQRAASDVADARGLCRVHLDAYWWAASRDNDAV